jgi:hypothetical protein
MPMLISDIRRSLGSAQTPPEKGKSVIVLLVPF